MKIGFHASLEQFAPGRLLNLVQRAEQSGFEAILSSDHFHPWSEEHGASGFAWSWIGSAMQATDLEFGVVNAPGQRYHPAIIAQAVATLLEMYPNRFWLSVGSGEALNERITGEEWPPKEVRNARLVESVEVMRKLWAGGYVNHHGFIKVEEAKLFTRPEQVPGVIGAAMTEETAGWISGWADGMITINKSIEELKQVVDAFKQEPKNASPEAAQKDLDKPMILKMQISYDTTKEKALDGAYEHWKNNIFPSKVMAHLNTPAKFDAIGEKSRKEDLKDFVIIGDQPNLFIEKIKAFAELGFEKIIIHNVNDEQEKFIDFFGKEVLPALKEE